MGTSSNMCVNHDIKVVCVCILKFSTLFLLFTLMDQTGRSSHLQPTISQLEVSQLVPRTNRDKMTKIMNRMALSIIEGKSSSDKYPKSPDGVKKSNSYFHNRITKCGSTSLKKMMEELGATNDFKLVGRGLPYIRTMREEDKSKLGSFLCSNSTSRMIFSRHLYLIDFSKYGCDIPYFNIVRDPVDRFISRYYYHRETLKRFRNQSEITQYGVEEQVERTVTDCVLGNYTECLYQGVLTKGDFQDSNVEDLKTMNLSRLSEHFHFNADSVLTYFCGDSEDCRTLGSRTALRTAKGNIKTKFIMVGALEKLEKSLEVLECKIPHYFKGISYLQKIQKVHMRQGENKEAVTDGEVRKILR